MEWIGLLGAVEDRVDRFDNVPFLRVLKDSTDQLDRLTSGEAVFPCNSHRSNFLSLLSQDRSHAWSGLWWWNGSRDWVRFTVDRCT